MIGNKESLEEIIAHELSTTANKILVSNHKRILEAKKPYTEELTVFARKYYPKSIAKSFSSGAFRQYWINEFIAWYAYLRDDEMEEMYRQLAFQAVKNPVAWTIAGLEDEVNHYLLLTEQERGDRALFLSLREVLVHREQYSLGD